MKVKFKNKLAWIFIVVIVCLSFTIIPGWIPFARKEWFFLVLGTIGIVTIYDSYFTTHSFGCLVFYFLILFFNQKFGDEVFNSLTNNIYEVLQFIVPSAICFYALQRSDEVFVRTVIILVFAVICIESVASYFINLQYPNIIRDLEGLARAASDRSFSYNFMKMGLANYSFVHALPIAIPPIVCFLKSSDTKRRWIWAIVLFAVCSLIYISASATATIMMAMMLLLAFLSNLNDISSNIRFLVIITLFFTPVLFSTTIQVTTIGFIQGFTDEDSYLFSKLESIKYSIENEDEGDDVEARVVQYNKSLDGFKENVFFGSNKKLGGHSALLDRLGNLGLVGVIPLFIFFYLQVDRTRKYIPDKYKVFYYEGVVAAFLMFALKSVGLWGLVLLCFVVLPFMLTESFKTK